jgi:hypothetical protein
MDAMRKELVTVGRGLTVLRDGRGMPEWQPPVLQSDGSRTFAWPKYPQPVMVALMAALEVTGHDFAYLEHIEAVRRTPIASASSSDLATWFTYLFRGERFSDGHIEGFIRSGQLQAMLERLLELSAGDDGAS